MRFYDLNKVENDVVSSSYKLKSVEGDTVSMTRVEVNKGEMTALRSHDVEVMVMVVKGKWLFNLPDGDVLVTDEQVLCIPAGTPFSSEVLEQTLAFDISPKAIPFRTFIPNIIINNDPEQYLWAV